MKDIFLAVLSTGVAAQLLKTLHALVVAWMKRRDDPFTDTMEQVHKCYTILNTLQRETHASRVVILATTNGGGVPTLGKNLYSSVLYEVCDLPLRPVKRRWQKQVLDAHYTEALMRMNGSGYHELITEEMPEGTLLHDLYEGEGVELGRIYRIYEGRTRFIYLSMNFTDTSELSPRERSMIRSAVSHLRELFQRHAEV